jgi:hypothetical protein
MLDDLNIWVLAAFVFVVVLSVFVGLAWSHMGRTQDRFDEWR